MSKTTVLVDVLHDLFEEEGLELSMSPAAGARIVEGLLASADQTESPSPRRATPNVDFEQLLDDYEQALREDAQTPSWERFGGRRSTNPAKHDSRRSVPTARERIIRAWGQR